MTAESRSHRTVWTSSSEDPKGNFKESSAVVSPGLIAKAIRREKGGMVRQMVKAGKAMLRASVGRGDVASPFGPFLQELVD